MCLSLSDDLKQLILSTTSAVVTVNLLDVSLSDASSFLFLAEV